MKVGSKVRYLEPSEDCINEDLTVGKIYTIVKEDNIGDFMFYDDVGDENWAASPYGDGLFEIVEH